RPHFITLVEANENLLHDPGGSCSAHVHSVYRSQGEAALFLPALFRKSDSPRIRVPRHADLDQESGTGLTPPSQDPIRRWRDGPLTVPPGGDTWPPSWTLEDNQSWKSAPPLPRTLVVP